MTEHGPDSVTFAMIAEAAGVSVSSVSRVLAGRGDLKRQTREKVLEAARALGYNRSSALRGRPATLDQRLIELVLGSFDDAWTSAVVAGTRQAAFRLGFDLVLTLERDDPSDDWPARVAMRKPSGVILGIIRPTHSQLDELRGLRIPIVLLDPRSDPEGELASVGTTDWQGGYDAGEHLAQSGALSFIVVTGVPAYRFGRAREEGFRAALAELAPEASIRRVESQWTNAAPTTALVRALKESALPVGVFAGNDEMALSVYAAVQRLDLAIPADVRIVGFNDEPRAVAATPPLTSVRQPLREMAGRAVELVRELREHQDDQFERVEIPSRLIIRRSSNRD
ncbi:substrate-binding domain-containing protein [Agreia sp. Leaf283]|uniref:substrate-binding domain-containing protein n=1 Tax=Agreia sp. Leaf283 TaxID=1736321 RepID=UPI0006F2259D|nr:substrate-binding domain-containing protein [Agreia sp. Leaf283]KQP56021.1 hypothetical protein ASF51_12910 [Agreia sp. Leaf283]